MGGRTANGLYVLTSRMPRRADFAGKAMREPFHFVDTAQLLGDVMVSIPPCDPDQVAIFACSGDPICGGSGL